MSGRKGLRERFPEDLPPDQRFVPGGGRSADHLFGNVVSLIGSRFPSEINSRVPDQPSNDFPWIFYDLSGPFLWLTADRSSILHERLSFHQRHSLSYRPLVSSKRFAHGQPPALIFYHWPEVLSARPDLRSLTLGLADGYEESPTMVHPVGVEEEGRG